MGMELRPLKFLLNATPHVTSEHLGEGEEQSTNPDAWPAGFWNCLGTPPGGSFSSLFKAEALVIQHVCRQMNVLGTA